MIAASVRYASEVNRSSQQMFSSSTVQQAEEVRTRVERTHLSGQALDARRTEMRTINDYAPVGTRKVGTGQVSSVQPVTFKRQVNPNHLLDMQILDGPKQVCLPHHPQLQGSVHPLIPCSKSPWLAHTHALSDNGTMAHLATIFEGSVLLLTLCSSLRRRSRSLTRKWSVWWRRSGLSRLTNAWRGLWSVSRWVHASSSTRLMTISRHFHKLKQRPGVARQTSQCMMPGRQAINWSMWFKDAVRPPSVHQRSIA
jgi:hypothetical protein